MTRKVHWQPLITEHLARAREPLIVVLGPTASGKTGFSVRLATRIRGEIVNADSRQLYRFLDIGTAKIRSEEKRGVPHHLFDVLDPKEPVTIAWYKAHATQVIDEILARKRVPILVGGSMLYISSIIDGLEPLPAVDPAVRRKLRDAYNRDAGKTLHRRLSAFDPDAAASIPCQNKVYLVRAMELIEAHRVKPSEAKRRGNCTYDLLILGMDVPREELARRIEDRTRAMFDAGWIDEVRSLRARGYTAADPGMESHGYREILHALERGCVDRQALEETIATKTRQYAKRQMTWWRGDPRIHWIDPQADTLRSSRAMERRRVLKATSRAD